MSSFSGLNTALTSLIAQRQAINTAGQNIANVNTPGYTRQRATLQAIDGSTGATLHSLPATTSGGVKVTSYERLGDIFLETRLRQESSTSGRLSALAETWSRMENGLAEPGESGLAHKLGDFFAFWEEVANSPADEAARSMLLEESRSLVTDLKGSYAAVRTQWETLRSQAEAVAVDINTTAEAIADLNARIKSIQVAGGSPNDLVDQRALLLTQLSGLTGAEARYRDDGTVDVMIGGNALVRGSVVSQVAVHGTREFSQLPDATGVTGPGAHDGIVRLVWADTGSSVGATGGQITGMIAGLGPADLDGPLASLAQTYNELAIELARSVNALHTTALTAGGEAGQNFFTDFPAGYSGVAVLDLEVLLTEHTQVAAAAPGGGDYDGSVADSISQLSSARDLWAMAVVDIGVQTRTAVQRSEASEFTRSSAESQLLSATAVDPDEEVVNMLTYQRGYEAAARLLTTIDEMLDTLINRTGVVGR